MATGRVSRLRDRSCYGHEVGKHVTGSFLTNIFSPTKRKFIYTLYSSVGLILGGVQAGLGAVEVGSPDWLKASLAVYAFFGTAIGATAASNVQQPDRQPRPIPDAH